MGNGSQLTSTLNTPADLIVDLAIVGAGPVGLYAAFYAGMREMSVKLIDSLPQLGGQLASLYPEQFIYDVPGFPRVLAKDLAANLAKQALQARPFLVLGESVSTIRSGESDQPYLLLTDKAEHRARTVLIVAGVGSLRPKPLSAAGANEFLNKGLDYALHDPAAYQGRRVLVIGGSDNALDWANALLPFASELTVVHRRDTFRACQPSVAQLRHSSARLFLSHEVVAIGGRQRVETVLLRNNQNNDVITLRVDAVLANVGYDSSLSAIRNWGVQLVGAGIQVDSTMQSSRRGVFAAGDIAAYPGKIKLIATGFGEAAIAVNHAKRHIDPSANLFPGHSSSVAPQRFGTRLSPE